jgi:hypothetical protein
MQIFVRGDRTVVINVEPTDTILSVKEQIWDREGIPPRYLLVTYAGRIREDWQTLNDCGVEVQTTIHYRIRF